MLEGRDRIIWFSTTCVIAAFSAIILLKLLHTTPITPDEVGSINRANGGFIRAVFNDDLKYNPPLHVMYLNVILNFTKNAYYARCCFSIFGVILVCLMCALGHKYFNAKTGVLAGLITLMNIYLLYQGVMMRGFMMMLCFIMAATYFFHDVYYFRKKTILYIIFAGLSLYAHYLAIIFIIIQMVFILSKDHNSGDKDEIFFFECMLVVILPAALMMLNGIQHRNIDYPSQALELSATHLFMPFFSSIAGMGSAVNLLLGAMILLSAFACLFTKNKTIPVIFWVSALVMLIAGGFIRLRTDQYLVLVPFAILSASRYLTKCFTDFSNGGRYIILGMIIFTLFAGSANGYRQFFQIANKDNKMRNIITENQAKTRIIIFEDQISLWEAHHFILRDSRDRDDIGNYKTTRIGGGFYIQIPAKKTIFFYTHDERSLLVNLKRFGSENYVILNNKRRGHGIIQNMRKFDFRCELTKETSEIQSWKCSI